MYGYIIPQKNGLLVQDFVLYRAYYCGICKATGKIYGQLPRFTTNYDMTFLTVLLHDVSSQDVEIKTGVCVLNPFKKKAVICRNALMDSLSAVNIMLAYHKAQDGVSDRDGLKYRIIRRVLRRAYKKAAAAYPQIDEIMRKSFEKLDMLEKQNLSSIDLVSDCFSSLMRDIAKLILKDKADDKILGMCYNIGKFVYLADALDDIDEDFKKSGYNPFLLEFKNYSSRRQFIEQNRADIEFILASCLNRATECFNNLTLTQSNRLLANIIYEGMRDKMHQLLNSDKKLPPVKV